MIIKIIIQIKSSIKYKYGCVLVIVLVMVLYIMNKKEYFNNRANNYKAFQQCYAVNGYTHILNPIR